ncbi:hypothetical protein BDZ91DRAFT_288813 [Kalaharituber pfeilii]|nr:hypothetical protein BDZ91DRAFT_288813 [Kalaharituber pfeilii]
MLVAEFLGAGKRAEERKNKAPAPVEGLFRLGTQEAVDTAAMFLPLEKVKRRRIVEHENVDGEGEEVEKKMKRRKKAPPKGKLDDLADSLLQGLAWVKWEEIRRRVMQGEMWGIKGVTVVEKKARVKVKVGDQKSKVEEKVAGKGKIGQKEVIVRGRPRNVVSVASAVQETTPAPQGIPSKRPRGRPRNVVSVASVVQETTPVPQGIPSKRPRGRPRNPPRNPPAVVCVQEDVKIVDGSEAQGNGDLANLAAEPSASIPKPESHISMEENLSLTRNSFSDPSPNSQQLTPPNANINITPLAQLEQTAQGASISVTSSTTMTTTTTIGVTVSSPSALPLHPASSFPLPTVSTAGVHTLAQPSPTTYSTKSISILQGQLLKNEKESTKLQGFNTNSLVLPHSLPVSEVPIETVAQPRKRGRGRPRLAQNTV